MSKELIPQGWSDLPFWKSLTWEEIQYYLKDKEYYPRREDWFTAYLLTPLSKVRAVILGQDPYHDGSAHGLAFSTLGRKIPPSLRNILLEYRTDLRYPEPRSGNLSAWARRGVLLLNSSLTVEPGKANSHKNIGWDELIQQTLSAVRVHNKDAVFILWGKSALETAGPILNGAHRVISAHPSPLAIGKTDIPFFGSRPFTKTNALLVNTGQEPINWELP